MASSHCQIPGAEALCLLEVLARCKGDNIMAIQYPERIYDEVGSQTVDFKLENASGYTGCIGGP